MRMVLKYDLKFCLENYFILGWKVFPVKNIQRLHKWIIITLDVNVSFIQKHINAEELQNIIARKLPAYEFLTVIAERISEGNIAIIFNVSLP